MVKHSPQILASEEKTTTTTTTNNKIVKNKSEMGVLKIVITEVTTEGFFWHRTLSSDGQ